MTSQLNVDTIKGKTTEGSITVQGEGSATTNLQQGLAKVWCNLNGTGTAAIRDSFNISGITDNGTGDYTYTFQNAMASVSYSFSASVRGDSASNDNIFNADNGHDFSTTVLIMRNRDVSAAQDSEQACIQTFGDLA
tara:strand:+ start:37 stop:444 length:408 start_codon:yes stop_codon:yes gene_type:complete